MDLSFLGAAFGKGLTILATTTALLPRIITAVQTVEGSSADGPTKAAAVADFALTGLAIAKSANDGGGWLGKADPGMIGGALKSEIDAAVKLLNAVGLLKPHAITAPAGG